jgi:hypothetical protein
MKGDRMFRSNWENGEIGTPELLKIKPKTTCLTAYLIFITNLRSLFPFYSAQVADQHPDFIQNPARQHLCIYFEFSSDSS